MPLWWDAPIAPKDKNPAPHVAGDVFAASGKGTQPARYAAGVVWTALLSQAQIRIKMLQRRVVPRKHKHGIYPLVGITSV